VIESASAAIAPSSPHAASLRRRAAVAFARPGFVLVDYGLVGLPYWRTHQGGSSGKKIGWTLA